MEIVIKIDRLDEILEVLKQLGGGCHCQSKHSAEEEKSDIAQTVTAPTPPEVPITPTTPMAAPVAPPVVPTKPPSYSLDQLAEAGASLMEMPGGQQQLSMLCAKFKVQSLPELQKKQYGAFAMELRNLGAQI